MTKRIVVDEVLSTHPGLFDTRASADQAVDAIFGAVARAVDRGERVQIRGFGSFQIKDKKGRTGRNPQTGAPLEIPARRELSFKLPRREN